MAYFIGGLVVLVAIALFVMGVELNEKSDTLARLNSELTEVAGGELLEECEVTGKWDLDSGERNHLYRHDSFLRVRFTIEDLGNGREYETIIDPDISVYLDLRSGGDGTVYVYPTEDCTRRQVETEMVKSITSRGNKSGGSVNWEKIGYFEEAA